MSKSHKKLRAVMTACPGDVRSSRDIVLFEPSGRMIATDEHRLHIGEIDGAEIHKENMPTLTVWRSLIDVAIADSEGAPISIDGPDHDPSISGWRGPPAPKFPDYARIVPKREAVKQGGILTVDRKQLDALIKHTIIDAKDKGNAVRVAILEDLEVDGMRRLRVSIGGTSNSFLNLLEYDRSSPRKDREVGIAVKYLQDALRLLKAYGRETIQIGWEDAMSPIVFNGDLNAEFSESNCLAIVMPIKI